MWVLWDPTLSSLSLSLSLWCCACAWAKLSAASDKSHTKSNQTIKVVVVQTTLVTPHSPGQPIATATASASACQMPHNGNDKFMRRTFAEHILAHSFPLQYIRIAIACCSCSVPHTLGHGLYLQLKCGRQSVACGLIAKSSERSRNAPRERETEREIGSDVEIARELERGEQNLHK